MKKTSKGYKSLLKSIKKDCDDGEGCFNPNGCDKQRYRYERGHCYANTKCMHSYCDKFKWVLDRVKHYAEKTGLTEEEILNSWEERRTYWVQNYYQESNQPLIQGDNVRVFDTREDIQKSLKGRGFRCPKCNHVSNTSQECGYDKCNWNSYGLLGTMGKGVSVFIKETFALVEIFMPIAWESKEN